MRVLTAMVTRCARSASNGVLGRGEVASGFGGQALIGNVRSEG
jgi:hypothetical protein